MADTNGTTVDREIDLSGDVCPYTFVKSKLALERMTSGDILRVRVDNGESAANVPRSMELEGHQVLSLDADADGWLITVKKA